MNNLTQKNWEHYRDTEMALMAPLCTHYGYDIDKDQPHVGGERFLMQAVTTTSGRKLILLGTEKKTGRRVVIKATTDTQGTREIERERMARKVLNEMRFAYGVFLSPQELLFVRKGDAVLSIQEFIEQPKTFLEHDIKQQFFFALQVFKAQEGAHATTYGHQRTARRFFDCVDDDYYFSLFSSFREKITAAFPDTAFLARLVRAEERMKGVRENIARYMGFLTHTDFVPHNVRINDSAIYLLDHSSLRFGNKYEGWARFINYMALYNPMLEAALIQYVQENRASEEYDALVAMRLFRLGEIMWYYTRSLAHTEGNLKELNTARVHFWSDVLEATLSGVPLTSERIRAYQELRDSLRSEEEKKRQVGLH